MKLFEVEMALSLFLARPVGRILRPGPARPVVIKLYVGPFGPLSINYYKKIGRQFGKIKRHFKDLMNLS